jgi:rhodanese-related sulfurtransferase
MPRARRRDRWVIPAAVVAALALSGPARALAEEAPAGSPAALRPAIDAANPGGRWVDTATLAGWMSGRDGRALVLLDARAPAEFEVSHLRGARRVDPEMRDVAALALPAGATIVVYCSVGYRSAAVAERLRAAGRERVFNLLGGIFQWANEGRPIYRGTREVRTVHPYDRVWGRLLLERYRER